MTLNCNGRLVDLATPKVMGILNLTPDSFYDGGRYANGGEVVERAAAMLEAGAVFLDIGAYSSRPGAAPVSEGEELRRLLPVLELLVNTFPDALWSIDTFRARVAEKCLEMGAAMINDISAGVMDPSIFSVVSRFRAAYVMMHMRGNPGNMQSKTDYKDLLQEMMMHFSERIAEARRHGILDIIVDPGFGFAKTLEQNYHVLKHLDLLQNLDMPLLVGLSRKSMIYKVLDTNADGALNGTTALHMRALAKGARILRAHDVREAVECTVLHGRLAN